MVEAQAGRLSAAPDVHVRGMTQQRIFIIGDSISIQYGPYLKALLPPRFAYDRKGGDDALRDLDKAVGANGGDSSMVLAYLRSLEASGGLQADVLLLNCGLHDIKTDPATGAKQVPIAAYEANLREVVAVGRRLCRTVVWMRVTPCDEAVHNHQQSTFHRFAADCLAYNAVADRVMAELGIAAIDLHGFTGRLGGKLYCDHVHFLPEVRQAQAAYLAGWLEASFPG
jgi:lysophospholipase L1-like esterase